MSDALAAAAAATGVPEELIQRAASARAEAAGVSTDDILQAWAGGGAAPVAAEPAAQETAAAEAPASETPDSSLQPPAKPAPDTAVEDEPVASAAAAVAPVAAFSRETVAPVLTGRRDNPWILLVGAVGLLLIGAIFGVLLPALDVAEAREAAIPGTTIEYSDEALDGRQIYLAEGCWYCHTQQVRPIVTDAGLGRVTSPALVATEGSDTLGFQRLGPDLANVAAREPFNEAGTIVAYLRNPEAVVEGSRQPAYAHLTSSELEAVAQYLIETSEPYAPDADE